MLAKKGENSRFSRQHQRFAVRLPVALLSKNYMIREETFTANVSSGGVFLYSENYGLDENDKVSLELKVGVKKKITLLGTVVWSNLFPVTLTPKPAKGIGIRLHAPEDPEFKRWMLDIGADFKH